LEQQLRVLHVFTPAAAGGLESVVEMLAPGLQARGASVAVLAVLSEGSPEPTSVAGLRSAGVKVFDHRTRPRGYRTEFRAHRGLVETWRPDVVHTHGYRADVVAGYAVGPRALRVTTVHGFTGGDWKNRLYEWLQVWAYRHFDAVVAVSRSVRERLQERGVRASRLELIPNAFSATGALSRSDARAELGLPADAPVVGWVGRLSFEKGADLLLAAAARLTDRRVRVSIIGDGQERAALEAQAAALGIGDRITWHGFVPRAGRLMPAFDLFVLSSRTEGTPIALFEAMAAAVPAVVTTVGGVPDVLDPQTGWLIQADSPDQLAQAIEHALSARPEAERRAAGARERLARDFATGPWIDRYLELYLDLVTRRSSLRS
jgi:glycosyltransferase involved in cell wall biosynthesis